MSTARVLIDYPAQFACSKQFSRKLDRILANLHSYTIFYSEDAEDLLSEWLEDNPEIAATRVLTGSIDHLGITHAIIFEAQDFPSHFRAIAGVATRVIPVRVTRVVNKDRGDAFDVYIGRGTKWGNPYAVGFGQSPGDDSDSRDEAIRKYKYDFDRGLLGKGTFKQDLIALRGKRLGCHCKPLACHGDVLANYLNSLDDGT